MKFRLLFVICLALFFAACDEEQKPETPSEPPTPSEPKSPPISEEGSTRDSIYGIMSNYYADLSAEEITARTYFAPRVKQFFSSVDQDPDEIEKLIRKGFESVEERSISLKKPSLSVSETVEGFVAEFEGEVVFVQSKSGVKIKEDFKNRVTFDPNLRIIRYESLEAERFVAEREVDEPADMRAAMDDFFAYCKFGDFSGASAFIHPDLGFYYVYRPGAFDSFLRASSISEVFEHASWLEELLKEIDCKPDTGNYPEFDCDTGFSIEGCFIRDKENYSRLSALMRSLTDLDMGTYAEEDADAISSLEKVVSAEFLTTDLTTTFHFGEVNGKWYLLVIDSAKYECGA